MIYYLFFLGIGVWMDFNDLKNSSKKTDIIFYVISILVCLLLGAYYFYNTDRMTVAEYILEIFNLGGK